jgi:glutamate synthase domain-containing protein 2
MAKKFLGWGLLVWACVLGGGLLYPPLWLLALVWGPVFFLGVYDFTQTRHSIRRNFPVIGHFRYLLESVRPEINQYFVESNSDGMPFSREQRSIVYQRSKRELDTLPFGTQKRVDDVGYEWATHSLAPRHVDPKSLRVVFGGPHCKQPYSASILNVSAMSYGSLSRNAVLALNGGAKSGGFAHNTGEGGLSPYHLENGGDLIWQIGTAYFSCRTADGKFSPGAFAERAALPNVKMIELKLSQGAKPSHGGILPAAKVTAEIAAIRGVAMGKDVVSPPAHTEFSTPIGLLEFVARLRELSGGKPVGFKLCIGKRREFIAIAKAMVKTGITPDFITVDGGEGGTGAAPLEFSNSVGYPLREGLVFLHNVLVGMGVRKHIRVIASGKVATGFDLVTKFALGADTCNSARAMMMALGCIQALRCNSNKCPTGVASQNPALTRGLVVPDKARRVANFHAETLRSVADLVGAMGLAHSGDVRPWHINRRTGTTEIRHFGEIFPFLEEGELLQKDIPKAYVRAFSAAVPETFAHA